MGIVFAVLALLAVSIKGISLLDREPSASSQPSEAASPAPITTPASAPVASGKITGQQVAAIAVALALSEPKAASIPTSISRADATAGSWLQSGRMRMLGSGSSGAFKIGRSGERRN